MGNKVTRINILVIGMPKSGKTYFLDNLTDEIYIPKFCNNSVMMDYENVRFELKEHNKYEKPLVFKYDVIMVIIRCNAKSETIFETKNRLLKIYSTDKKPICIIHNQYNEKQKNTLDFKKRNEILQTKNFDSLLTAVINFKNVESAQRIESILKWIIRKTTISVNSAERI